VLHGRRGCTIGSGYATDYAFGDKRGLQTLALKSGRRSAYVRLQWETVMRLPTGEVDTVVEDAIRELSAMLRLTSVVVQTARHSSPNTTKAR
jgi:hypothetical protein